MREKTERVTVRLSPEHRGMIIAMSELAGQSGNMSAGFRHLINQAQKSVGQMGDVGHFWQEQKSERFNA